MKLLIIYSKKFTILFIAFTISHVCLAQNKMRSLQELIVTKDPGWAFVQPMIDSAKNKVTVLQVDTTVAKQALYNTQLTTRSPMGAIIYNTGGILVDDGWIRILGSGSKKLNRSLPDWNKGKSFTNFGDTPAYLLIADDAVGGFFAINYGGLGKDKGNAYYLSPDRLVWEPLGLTYTDFLNFCFNNNLNEFYESLRWKDWKKQVVKLDGDKVYSFKPFLWSKEGKDINKNKRKVVPVEEQFQFNMDARVKLGLDKKTVE